MRYLPRIALPPTVLLALQSYQNWLNEVIATERRNVDPKTDNQIERFWKCRRANHAMKAVDRALRAMASGLERCMYCEDSRGCDVEHGHPKVAFAEQAFAWPNLWVCADCNRDKNDCFDADMIDPTREDPLEHLGLTFSEGRYAEREGSKRGTATLRTVPRLASDQKLIRGRKNAWTKLKRFLHDYDSDCRRGDQAEADETRKIVVEEPFSAVFAAVLRTSREPGAAEVLGADITAILERHPAMYRWLSEADAARVVAVMPEIERFARSLKVRRREPGSAP